MRLKDKVAIITGAAAGMGAATARRFDLVAGTAQRTGYGHRHAGTRDADDR